MEKNEYHRKKFGFDIHGVLDDLPETFLALNRALYDAGHEIHIITGITAGKEVLQELLDIGIRWHRFFSIVDYHKSIGTPIEYGKDGLPWLDRELWNKTKGEYCKRVGIDMHFDDTGEYEQYFHTPFARVWTKNNRNGRGIKPTATAVLPNLHAGHVHAPWTDEQVNSINRYQKIGIPHPLTCAAPGCTSTDCILVAKHDGMHCECGQWKQDWVHDFMTKPLNDPLRLL